MALCVVSVTNSSENSGILGVDFQNGLWSLQQILKWRRCSARSLRNHPENPFRILPGALHFYHLHDVWAILMEKDYAFSPVDFECPTETVLLFVSLSWALFRVGRRFPGMSFMRERKAVFTDSESGKYSRASGAKTTPPSRGFTSLTTFVPSG